MSSDSSNRRQNRERDERHSAARGWRPK